MPIYEYECQACGHRFEEWQKMSDKPVEVCPKCEAHKVEKLISQTAFHLKGGGWYSDLYSSQKPAASSSSKPGAESGGSEKSNSGGDKTPPSPSSPSTEGKKGASKAA
jgi:putative FmdB family regulatory protein